MDWHATIFELIDMRSFSNLWFWIALAVMWSTASHWILGVPFDLVSRARRHGGQAAEDLEALVRINTNRLLYIGTVSGLWLLGFVCFVITGLALLGFIYRVEFAQALFLLGFPMTIVGALNLSTARLIQDREAEGEDLWRYLSRHRTIVQAIGMVSIFVTALWGMYQNMAVGPFGG
ncbi:component of SufBCD complex [Tateyamaria sp. SN6-1]|uniref:component of SufBCD complex n=1 Tax=Tateyamaria sp. SN6-1 TaxID=3092148 RepID=UPI0039F5BF45